MPTAVDLFAGAGGATQGLRDAGFDVPVAVEIESDPAATWRLNHPGVLIEKDIRHVSGDDIRNAGLLASTTLDLLKACPPCQGFSSLKGATTPDQARNDLVLDVLRLVEELKPRAVLLENVPGLRRDERFSRLNASLSAVGYGLNHFDIEASDLGVPQRRRRLVLVAVASDQGSVPNHLTQLIPLRNRRHARTAGRTLADLDAKLDPGDSVHRWRQSSDKVQARIAAIPVGGSRFDLPDEHRLACHERLRSAGGDYSRVATGSYGRIKLDRPAPTMTTRCTTPACGSFIHPTENRGISLREAAAFQTFPADYKWHGGYDSIERQIGNAVPVWMAEALGQAVLRLLSSGPHNGSSGTLPAA